MDNRHKELLTFIINFYEKKTIYKDSKRGIEVKGGIMKQNPKGDGFTSIEERYEGLLELEKNGYIKISPKYNPNWPFQTQKEYITLLKKEFEEQ